MQLADLCCLLLWVDARLAFKHAHVVGFWSMVTGHEAQVQGHCMKLVVAATSTLSIVTGFCARGLQWLVTACLQCQVVCCDAVWT